ncbi:LPXTG cell wall anchor domain-containing protein, partial [Mesorhizobium sp. M7A.F.Ca.CA.002.15.1.1]
RLWLLTPADAALSSAANTARLTTLLGLLLLGLIAYVLTRRRRWPGDDRQRRKTTPVRRGGAGFARCSPRLASVAADARRRCSLLGRQYGAPDHAPGLAASRLDCLRADPAPA